MPPPLLKSDPEPLEEEEDIQSQESWTSQHEQQQNSEVENDESQEGINVEEEHDADHPIIIDDQVVEFHHDQEEDFDHHTGDFGHEEVIEVVQHDSNNEEVRVIRFPVSALRAAAASQEFEQVDENPENLVQIVQKTEEIETSLADLPQEEHEEEVIVESTSQEEIDSTLVVMDHDGSLEFQSVAAEEKPVQFESKAPEVEVDTTENIIKVPAEPEPEPFPNDRCANCMKIFEQGMSKVSKICRSIQETTEFPPPETETQVSNIEALHLIFQLPKETQRECDECFLCEKCAKILIALYSAFKDFTELAQEEAYVLRKLNEISEESNKKKGRRRKQTNNLKKLDSNEDFNCPEIKAEVEWEEEDEDEELITGDFSDDEDFQASETELAAAGVESSSSSSDDEMYVPVKKKKLVKQSRSKKSVGLLDDFFWDSNIKQEPFSDDDEFGKRKRKYAKRSRNRKSLLSGLTYDCNLCDESFLKPRALKQHLHEFHKKTHHNAFDAPQDKSEDGEAAAVPLVPTNNEEEIPEMPKVEEQVSQICRICVKEFETKAELKDHFMEEHEGELPFKCSKCERQFGENSALKRHEISHTEIKPYKCRVCLSAFRRADELRNHWADEHVQEHVVEDEEPQERNVSKNKKRDPLEIKSKKNKEKPEKSLVPCEVCGKAFARHDHLKLHIRIHTGEKPFKCNFNECGKAFSDPRGLAYHEVTHSNERPYCCTVCGMTFKRLHHLNDHERNHRDDIERPFACDICGKCFKYKKHLNSHMVIHGSSKDFTCEICGKSFNRKDNLRQHVKKVHGKEPGPSTMSFVVTTGSQLITSANSTAIVTQALPLDASLDQIVYMHL